MKDSIAATATACNEAAQKMWNDFNEDITYLQNRVEVDVFADHLDHFLRSGFAFSFNTAALGRTIRGLPQSFGDYQA